MILYFAYVLWRNHLGVQTRGRKSFKRKKIKKKISIKKSRTTNIALCWSRKVEEDVRAEGKNVYRKISTWSVISCQECPQQHIIVEKANVVDELDL